jgi:hypothetical protein
MDPVNRCIETITRVVAFLLLCISKFSSFYVVPIVTMMISSF